MPLRDCVITYASASTVWSDPAVPESLQRDLVSNPASLLQAAAARPVKIGREGIIGQSEWAVGNENLSVAVKVYRPRSLGKALAAMFRPAKALQNWEKADFLLARQIATPQPLLACRPRGWKASGSILVTQWISGAENLHLFGWRIAALPSEQRTRIAALCAAAAGRLIGRIHAAGASHRDLKAANLLAIDDRGDVLVYLVDLDGLRANGLAGLQRQARDLARLAAGLAAHPWVTRSICWRFLRAYRAQLHEGGADLKCLWRAIAAETAKIVQRKRQRGEQVL